MRILVAGRSGQLATALAALDGSEPGLEIVTLGRPALDLGDPQGVTAHVAALRPDLVVNAAAYTAVDKAESEEAEAMRINAAGAGALAEAAARAGVPLIHVSTDYVYDGEKAGPYVESDPVNPLGAYGRSKLAGEAAVAAVGGVHAVLRTAWVYSAVGANFVKTMLRLAADRPEIKVVADQTGHPTYAPDLAAAVVAMGRRLDAAPQDRSLQGVFHLAGPDPATWFDLASEVMAISKELGGPSATIVPIPTEAYPTPARRPKNARLDMARIRDAYGIVLPPRRESLRRCLGLLVGGR